MGEKIGGDDYANGFGEWGNFEGEHVRGDAEGEISADTYARGENESEADYKRRLAEMRAYAEMAQEDVAKAEADLAIAEADRIAKEEEEAYRASGLGKYEASLRAKQAQGIYKPEEVEAFLSSARERLALRDWLEQREGSQRENAGYANGFGEWGNFEGEHVRGDAEGEVDFKSYPRLKGESPQQYGERLKTMRYLMNAAEEDARGVENDEVGEEQQDSVLDKYEESLRAKQAQGIYTEAEVERLLEVAKDRYADSSRFKELYPSLFSGDMDKVLKREDVVAGTNRDVDARDSGELVSDEVQADDPGDTNGNKGDSGSGADNGESSSVQDGGNENDSAPRGDSEGSTPVQRGNGEGGDGSGSGDNSGELKPDQDDDKGEAKKTYEELLDEVKKNAEFQKWLAKKLPDLKVSEILSMEEGQLRDLWSEWQSKKDEIEKKPLTVTMISRERDALDMASLAAQEMLRADLAEGGRLSRFVKGIWKGNLFRGYYLEKNRKEAYEKIAKLKDGDSVELAGVGWSGKSQSLIERFVADYDEALHREAGEWKNVLAEDHPATVEAKSLIKKFAEDSNMSEADFEEGMKRVKAMLIEGGNDGKSTELGGIVIDNYLDIAKTARERLNHEESIDRVMEGFSIVIGEARSNMRSATHRKAFDSILEKWQKNGYVNWIPTEVVGGAASAALWFGTKGATNLVRIATAGLGGSLVNGIVAGAKERNRVADDREEMAWRLANGLEVGKTKYDEELKSTIHEGYPVRNLTENLKAAVESGDKNALREQLILTEAWTSLSYGLGASGMLRYSGPSQEVRDKEIFDLDLARSQAKVALKNGAPEIWQAFESDVAAKRKAITQELLDPKDQAFVKLQNKRAFAMGAKTTAAGLVSIPVMQEVAATFNPNSYGVLDRVLNLENNPDAKLTWLAELTGGKGSMSDSLIGEGVKLSQEQIADYESQGYVVSDPYQVDGGESSKTVSVTAREYASKHGVRTIRDSWGTNGTSISDGNELGAHYTASGDGIRTVMGGNSVTMDGQTINFDQALAEGKIRAFVSLTEDSQSTPIEVTGKLINNGSQIEFVPEPGSAAAQCFSNGKFIGKYFEIAYAADGVGSDGAQHIIPLATVVGEGVDGQSFSDTITDSVVENVYDVFGPTTSNGGLVGGAPLPFVRRTEFTNGQSRSQEEPNSSAARSQNLTRNQDGVGQNTAIRNGNDMNEGMDGGKGEEPNATGADGAREGGSGQETDRRREGDTGNRGVRPEDLRLQDRKIEDGYNEEGRENWDALKDQIGGEMGLRIVKGDFDSLAETNSSELQTIFEIWWNGLSQDVRERFLGKRGYGMLLSPESDALFDWLRANNEVASAAELYRG